VKTHPLLQRLALLLLLVPLSALGQSKAPKKAAPAHAASPRAAAPVAPPKLQVTVEGLMDRRVSSDFPPPRLEVSLKLEGEDAKAVQAAQAKVTKAEDDTGKSLVLGSSGSSGSSGDERWQEGRGGEPPAPSLSLAGPSRKARSLTALEGVVAVYLPSRDPGALVKIEKVASKKDKSPVVSQALAAQKIKLSVLSKEGLEKEKKAAEAKKKADAAKAATPNSASPDAPVAE
jgi:hypothetical protein